MSELSPMMQQYFEVKNQHKDEIVFFRLGDFYEMFFDDAVLVAKELDLTLTGRSCGSNERAPMCGVPYHNCESYIARLIAKGYKVVMCDQQEEANGRTLVRREVSKVITPGTVLDENMLDESKNNFLCSVFFLKMSAGVSFCDISTGELKITNFSGENFLNKLKNEIKIFSPKETLIGGDVPDNFKKFIHKFCSFGFRDAQKDFETNKNDIIIFLKNKLNLNYQECENCFTNQNSFIVSRCLSMLFTYLSETQKKKFDFIKDVKIYEGSEFMRLECGAAINLELFETIRTKQKKGSLIWVLGKTRTAMGKRLLRTYLEKPLKDVNKINERLDGVEELINNILITDELREILGRIGDIQRLLSKISFGSANCRDLKSLGAAVSTFESVKNLVKNMKSEILQDIFENIDELRDIFALIESSIVDEPPVLTRDGGFIKKGFNKELDLILEDMDGGENLADKIEKKEREKTGIPKLKVGFNKIFGYYIEVSASYKNMVPKDYIRRQTLAGRERFITEELKTIEARIFSAKDRRIKLENKILSEIKNKISEQSERISRTASAIAKLDVLRSFAEVSIENSYTKPVIEKSDVLELKDSRHPVIEKILENTNSFVPNDVYFDENNKSIVITGPNMAGKSTYMRQIALNIIMAQIGCFVAASQAKIGIIDSIFTRIGASDDVASGQSTFMVEMNEVAQIANNAGSKSLVLLDEIGRGTSTFDGLSIAMAVLEFMTQKIKAKTLFSTHYHEISKAPINGVRNFRVDVKKDGDEIIFLRKIISGASDDSFGIEVAKLAGVPNSIINRAKEILHKLENKDIKIEKSSQNSPRNNRNFDEIFSKIKNIDTNSLTPIEAMNILFEISKIIK